MHCTNTVASRVGPNSVNVFPLCAYSWIKGGSEVTVIQYVLWLEHAVGGRACSRPIPQGVLCSVRAQRCKLSLSAIHSVNQ